MKTCFKGSLKCAEVTMWILSCICMYEIIMLRDFVHFLSGVKQNKQTNATENSRLTRWNPQ